MRQIRAAANAASSLRSRSPSQLPPADAAPSGSFLPFCLIGVPSVVVLGFRLWFVYYPYMSSIVGKRRGKQTYYYLVESARVDGQPRVVSQQHD